MRGSWFVCLRRSDGSPSRNLLRESQFTEVSAVAGERIGATFGIGPSFPPVNGSISREETWLYSVGDLTDSLLELWEALFGPEIEPDPLWYPEPPGPCGR